jgi:hypothetical protein
MKTRELANLGIPRNKSVMPLAQEVVKAYAKARKGAVDRNQLREVILELIQWPDTFLAGH